MATSTFGIVAFVCCFFCVFLLALREFLGSLLLALLCFLVVLFFGLHAPFSPLFNNNNEYVFDNNKKQSPFFENLLEQQSHILSELPNKNDKIVVFFPSSILVSGVKRDGVGLSVGTTKPKKKKEEDKKKEIESTTTKKRRGRESKRKRGKARGNKEEGKGEKRGRKTNQSAALVRGLRSHVSGKISSWKKVLSYL